MTIKIELGPEAEAQLLSEARAQGVRPEQAAEHLLREALALRSGPRGNLTVSDFHNMLDGLAKGSDELPSLPTESFTRESFYEDLA